MSPDVVRRLRLLLLAVILALSVWSMVSQWSELRSSASKLGWQPLAASFAAACAALFTSALAWSNLVRGAGVNVANGRSLPFFLLTQLGKYLPGGFGPAVAQASLASQYGVSKTAAANAYVVFAAQTVVLGLAVAAVGLPLGGSDLLGQYWWAFLVLPLVLPILHPGLLQRVLTRAIRLLGRSTEVPRVTWNAMLRSAGWTVATWSLLGLHLAFLASAYTDLAVDLVLLSLGGFALAWVSGFLVLFLPAGLGAREVVLIATLGLLLASADAATIAIASRGILTGADLLVGAGAGMATARLRQA